MGSSSARDFINDENANIGNYSYRSEKNVLGDEGMNM